MPRSAKKSKNFWEIIETAEASDDLDTVDKILQEGFVKAEKSSSPFSPAIDMQDDFRAEYFSSQEGGAEAGFGGDLALAAANRASRARRAIAYRLKTAFGFNGIKLVEEGDSWTQYPVFLEDIVDQLSENDDIAIYSTGAAGDLITDIAKEKEYIRALEKTGARGLILSGAGNDIFNDFGRLLNQYQGGLSPEQLINQSALYEVFSTVIDSYRTIIRDVDETFPGVVIFGHGYDLPYPDDEGSWIGPPLTQKNIPHETGRNIVKLIMNRFNESLAELAGKHSNFFFNDLRGVVDKGGNSWHDELHPKNAGYARAAAVFENNIRALLSGGQENIFVSHSPAPESHFLSSSEVNTFAALAEHHTGSGNKIIVLDPGHGGPSNPLKVGGSSWNNAVGPNGTLEKTLTLDITKRTRDILKDRGFTVKLTRESDNNLSLNNRARTAKDLGAAAFISIHFNGSNEHTAQGTETFVHRSLNAASAGKDSKKLCLAMQSEMISALGLKDRNAIHPGGIKYGGYGVLNPLRHAPSTACVLHEVSFLDRTDEEIKLSRVSYRRKIAVALADGIESYLDARFHGTEAFLAAEEVGDAIELVAFEAEVAGNVYSYSHVPKPTDGVESAEQVSDISNGYMIVEQDDNAEDFLQSLADYEAHYFQLGGEMQSVHTGENNEPSEYDPTVEQTFGQLNENSQNNLLLLHELFGETSAGLSYGPEASSTPVDFDLADFQAYIGSLNLQHFSATEFLVKGANNKPGGKGAGLNTHPPRHLWPNLGNTAKMLDEIRKRLNAPVYILSVYRSPAYNTAIDGAAHSRHKQFDAIDWHSTSGSVHDWLSVARAVSNSRPAAFKGWMKAYTGNNFVHIDTRHRTAEL